MIFCVLKAMWATTLSAGIDPTHPDLRPKLLRDGNDFAMFDAITQTAGKDAANDGHGHGVLVCKARRGSTAETGPVRVAWEAVHASLAADAGWARSNT